jgi:hypothetical protein
VGVGCVHLMEWLKVHVFYSVELTAERRAVVTVGCIAFRS